MAEALAPAKVNLTLHVTGQRADGYHLLDSLVVFAATGDRLSVEPDAQLGLTITGPRGTGLAADDRNLVLRAAALLQPEPEQGARITLEKYLPVASGIGGGSSDAATALRLLAALWHRDIPGVEAAMRLGADLPVCLAARPSRMAGVGERLSPVPEIPPAWLVLVNPGVAVSTPAIFRALRRRDNPPMPEVLPQWPDAQALAAWLATQRNDMEPAARAEAPVIDSALAALGAQRGCLLARMSGSGATCFGLFGEERRAAEAAAAIAADWPGWWVDHAAVLPR
ncbi:4-(cytidine 5'-diphospho)-2-C-methyl-D-erythritol kinase [Thioclava sp. BHET1]|nr:4-(cytidine 5'-diphospho)-2-C-methyl-D-erythritol kinase [Thioclava sp. BHET1]